MAPTHAARYARQVGSVLADAVPTGELAAAREELPHEYWELAERVLPDPRRRRRHGSFAKVRNGPKPRAVTGGGGGVRSA